MNRKRVIPLILLLAFLIPQLVAQDSQTVYVTKTGSKYHSAGCRYLKKSSIPISLEQAIRSYSACSVCSPPREVAAKKKVEKIEKVEVKKIEADTILGRTVGITDGDTITVLDGTTNYKIRLNGIDAPESGQAFGTKAKEYLSDLIFDKEVRVVLHGKDKYGRYLGDIFIGDTSINQSMVESGFAWHYKQYSTDGSLAAAEDKARAQKLGLWTDPGAVAPWEFRK